MLTLTLPAVTFVICSEITVANSLDPDQGGQNVGPDLGPKHLTHSDSVLKIFFFKVNTKKLQQTTTEA